jgi:hypothetical protein
LADPAFQQIVTKWQRGRRGRRDEDLAKHPTGELARYPLGPSPTHAVPDYDELLCSGVVRDVQDVAAESFQCESGLRLIGFAVSSQVDGDHSEIRQVQAADDFPPRVA